MIASPQPEVVATADRDALEVIRTAGQGVWDERTDVLVAGYGYAGGMAAVAAADSGAKVILTEKLPFPGGVSAASGGGMAIALDANGCYEYLRATTAGTTPDQVLRTMAKGMAELPELIHSLEQHSGQMLPDVRGVVDPNSHSTYPFPGEASIKSLKIGAIEGFNGLPWVTGMRGGARLFKAVMDNVGVRDIDVRFRSALIDLITDESRRVIGALLRSESGYTRVKLGGGLVLAVGGFENDAELHRQFYTTAPVHAVTGLGNTGDGVRIAARHGAGLWHMNHFHGGYGFKLPEFDHAFRHPISGPRVPDRLMPWIVVDQGGRRFMNEYPRAVQDTPIRDMVAFDPDSLKFRRAPSYMILDADGLAKGPVAFPITQGERPGYKWSADNAAEVEKGWIRCAATLEDLERLLGMPERELSRTVRRWNAGVRDGADPDFGRLYAGMAPIRKAPFYAAEVWPVVSNTQGGPVHDEHQRVLDAFGLPIPGLFAAGELGSIYGHLYLEAGNIAECFVGGRIAGQGAARRVAGT